MSKELIETGGFMPPMLKNDELDTLERVAKYVVQSKMFGVRDEAQAVSLMLVGRSEGIDYVKALREYHVVGNTPVKKAENMLRDFQLAGGRVTWLAYGPRQVKATFSHPQGGEVTIDWTWERASKIEVESWEGYGQQRQKVRSKLVEKDNWKNYPEAMMRSRCISEGVTTVWPAAKSGMLTPEEAIDHTQVEVHGERVGGEPKTISIDQSRVPSEKPEPEAEVIPAEKDGDQAEIDAFMKDIAESTTLGELDGIGEIMKTKPERLRNTVRAAYRKRQHELKREAMAKQPPPDIDAEWA